MRHKPCAPIQVIQPTSVVEVVEEEHRRTDGALEEVVFYHCGRGLKFDTDPVRGFAYSRLISVPVALERDVTFFVNPKSVDAGVIPNRLSEIKLQLFVEMVLEDVPLFGGFVAKYLVYVYTCHVA